MNDLAYAIALGPAVVILVVVTVAGWSAVRVHRKREAQRAADVALRKCRGANASTERGNAEVHAEYECERVRSRIERVG
jgi:hypothetical protein